MGKLVFADGHMHSNPVKGLGIAGIGRKFLDNGGWFIVLVSLPPHHLDLENSFDGYVKSFDVFISECRKARELKLKTVCLLGIHPAAIEDEVSRDPKRSVKVLDKAIMVVNYIAKLVKEGLVNGFGEIGRPHYRAIPEAFIVNNMVTRYTFELARDLDAIVHLHLEQGGELTALDIENLVKSIGIDRAKVVLHHLDVATAKASQKRDLVFTVPGKYPVLREVFTSIKPFYMVESDFIDDPKRPGVSSYPWDIVENQKKLLTEGVIDEEYLYKLNIDTVVKIYRVEPP